MTHYDWAGGREAVLRHGPVDRPPLLILPALFEEANRMRRFTVALMRALGEHGVATVLPDLPATGDSVLPTEAARLTDWRAAARACAVTTGATASIAIRGGALCDLDTGWRLEPVAGAALLRDLARATALTAGTRAGDVEAAAVAAGATLAGNRLSANLCAALATATPDDGHHRVARVGDGAAARDVTLSGTRLWRSAEPGDDPALVADAAADILTWWPTCAAR